MTLIEIIVVITIIALLTAAVAVSVIPQLEASKRDRARGIDIPAIKQGLDTYYAKKGKYPDTGMGLKALVDNQIMDKTPTDPWDHEYIYLLESNKPSKSSCLDDLSRSCLLFANSELGFEKESSMSATNLKPQDVVVAMKFACRDPERPWQYAPLAQELCLSPSELHASVKRLGVCRLWNPVLRRVDRTALRNFLVHGLVHVFPARPESDALGMPTGISAAPLAGKFLAGAEEQLVWPQRGGGVRGRRVEPLYKCVPDAAAKDSALYEMLALADALRTGRARERNAAAELLTERLS